MSECHLTINGHIDPDVGEAMCGSVYRIQGGALGDGGHEPDYVRAPTLLTTKQPLVTCLRCLTKISGMRHYRGVLTAAERELVREHRLAQGRKRFVAVGACPDCERPFEAPEETPDWDMTLAPFVILSRRYCRDCSASSPVYETQD